MTMTKTPGNPGPGGNRRFPRRLMVLLLVGVLGVAFTSCGSDDTSDVATDGADSAAGTEGEQTAAVEITGDGLGPMPEGVRVATAENDPVAGTPAPELVGTDFAGNELVIGNDGRAKVIYFVAHWCPHCQDEIPVVQELIDDGVQPEAVDIYAVSTAVDEGQGNFPPQAWLIDENFTPPVVRDSAGNELFRAFGGSSFPYAVYLDAGNNIVARTAGGMEKSVTTELWNLAAGG